MQQGAFANHQRCSRPLSRSSGPGFRLGVSRQDRCHITHTLALPRELWVCETLGPPLRTTALPEFAWIHSILASKALREIDPEA